MTNHQPDPRSGFTIVDLVDALVQMRDALTSASLLLRDIQFELDLEKRQDALERTHDVLKQVK